LALGFLATKARSEVLTLSPPADLVSGLVDALDHLRSTAAAERRAVLDTLVDDLATGGRLTARRGLVSEVLTVAIDEAGDRVGVQSSRLLRGDGSPAELRTAVAELSGLLDLLEEVDGDWPSAPRADG
jgi:hypothetical protein